MKIFIVLFMLLSFLNAKSYLLSSIPLPSTEIMNIWVEPCNEECLHLHLSRGEVFSFLSKFNKITSNDSKLKSEYLANASLFNLIQEVVVDVEIAILFPQKKIGKYVSGTTKSVLAYLLSQSGGFKLETFDCGDESELSVKNSLNEIRSKNFKNIIAIFTNDGLQYLQKYGENLRIFVPTINKNSVDIGASNIIFGGIDYKAQVSKLNSFTNDKIAVFYDKSPVSKKVTSYIENTQYQREIDTDAANFKNIFKENQALNYASLFLNTPVVASSLILSQITYHKKPIHRILSTQINYNPMLINLTQPRDSEKLLIANSITTVENSMLSDYNKLLLNDIDFDWINYTTTVGTDYLYSLITEENRYFKEKIENNQVIYNLNIVKVENSGFKPF